MLGGVLDGAKTAYLAVRGFATPAKKTQPMPTRTRTVSGHTWLKLGVAFFKDTRRVVTVSGNIVHIWDVETGTLGLATTCVAVSPDDRRVASSGDGNITTWDVDKRKVLGALVLMEHADAVRSLCFSSDGKRLASGSLYGTVIIWNAETGAILSTLVKGNLSSVFCVAFSPDGLKLASGTWRNIRQLVSASHDKTVKFWDSSNGIQIGQPCTAHTDKVFSLAISPDGSFIATASYDKTVRLWSTKSHQQIGQTLEHTACVFSVPISPSGESLATFGMDSSYNFYFAYRSKVKLGQKLYAEALSDAEKVIELNPSSHLGYELKHAALRGVQRYDDASQTFTIMLSKLDDAPDPQIRQLRQQYVTIHAQLENAPLRLIDTITGHICDRNAQINGFTEKVVAKNFSWVMLSHKWERKEPPLHDIQGRDIYDLSAVGTVVKLQKFCKVARDAGHHWAWSDTCCIDQNNNVELQQSVNSMFVCIWNTRGWTVQEFLAPKIVLFYQADWTLYLGNRSHNHKGSVSIMRELEHSTGINARALVDFRPGTRDARKKLRWASNRDTTREEDIAYSLFGIFDGNLPVIYGEKRQKALGRLRRNHSPGLGGTIVEFQQLSPSRHFLIQGSVMYTAISIRRRDAKLGLYAAKHCGCGVGLETVYPP
ncbi:WD40 repeat-like protein [Suillus weaverae]|nr:WD40 repeat-like protein [Suillus weaverae]